MDSVDRRQFLAASAGVLGVGLAGCAGDDGATEDVPLGIENLTLTATEPRGYREFTEAEDDVYDGGETVWFYFEPVGPETGSVGDGEARIELTTTLRIEDPGGTELFADEAVVTEQVVEETDEDLFLFWNFQPSRSAEHGEYTATIGLVDEVGEERTSATTTFSVEA